MTQFDVFNGDADGICALHQLRLAEPKDSVLITGVKRDIDLLRKVDAADDDEVLVLDISMDKNHKALDTLLARNINVTYFDHHFPGDIPQHDCLDAYINTDGNVCTGLLVDQHLNHRYLAWAVTAAFGDNLFDVAKEAAQPLSLDSEQLNALEQLGTLLNYNGYGSTIADLHLPPEALYRSLSPYESPFDYIHNDPAYDTLKNGYNSDMERVADLEPSLSEDACALYILPNEPFSRRVSGVYGNLLARNHPDRAHALLSQLDEDAYLVSVRAPLATREGADELCRQFETGGGRKAAAGINRLPATDFDRFTDAFQQQFKG